MIFSHLQITNWRQFRELDITFHDQLTILTGANGAGKTTVLNLLSRHFGWEGTLVSTPRRSHSGVEYFADYWTDDYLGRYSAWLDKKVDQFEEPPVPEPTAGSQQAIGDLTYGDGATTRLSVPVPVGSSFQIIIQSQRPQQGLHIPSHRPMFAYQTVSTIPTVPRRRSEAFSAYMDIVRSRYYGGHHQRTPNYYMKETLIALAAFGHGNQIIDPDSESLATFQGFEKILRTILPPSLGFTRLAVRLPEVVLVTRSGDFSLDAVSGGIAALVDLAWQVFMFAKADTQFAVTIDEPENHLHPELQRTLLPTFITAFPNVQFICATHNPFIVTSVPEANTYALRYGNDSKVSSEFLSAVDRSGSSNEILRDVLGLPSSSPIWVEGRLREIERTLIGQELTPELVTELQGRLRELGLERFIPAALARLVKDRLSQ